MRKIKSIILSAMTVFAVAVPFLSTNTFAADAFQACTSGNKSSVSSSAANQSPICSDKSGGNLTTVIHTVINVLLFIIGAIAVVVVIISGIQYVTSGGDSGAVAKAKNTLLYAIIGIVVAFLAYAIVNWVFTQFK